MPTKKRGLDHLKERALSWTGDRWYCGKSRRNLPDQKAAIKGFALPQKGNSEEGPPGQALEPPLPLGKPKEKKNVAGPEARANRRGGEVEPQSRNTAGTRRLISGV